MIEWCFDKSNGAAEMSTVHISFSPEERHALANGLDASLVDFTLLVPV